MFTLEGLSTTSWLEALVMWKPKHPIAGGDGGIIIKRDWVSGGLRGKHLNVYRYITHSGHVTRYRCLLRRVFAFFLDGSWKRMLLKKGNLWTSLMLSDEHKAEEEEDEDARRIINLSN